MTILLDNKVKVIIKFTCKTEKINMIISAKCMLTWIPKYSRSLISVKWYALYRTETANEKIHVLQLQLLKLLMIGYWISDGKATE